MSRFQPGQLWRYKARPGEEASRIAIAKVESHPKLGNIIHIQVTGVAIKSPTAPGGISRVISHLPYEELALRASVTAEEKPGAVADAWEQGYREWKSAFDAGKAGVWSVRWRMPFRRWNRR